MPIRYVSLDCAGTLIQVDWQPAVFAVDCAERVGVELDRASAESSYLRLLQTRWPHYMELNLTRDPAVCDGFWKELTRDWLEDAGVDAEWFEAIWKEAWNGLYGYESRVFSVYDDTVDGLEMLKERGVTVAALSNWDYSLHRVVELLEIRPYFKEVIASLEEGVEKPEPELFQIMLEWLGASPDEVLHVGDHPVDDVRGALNVGMRAALLERLDSPAAQEAYPYLPNVQRGEAGAPRLSSLRQLGQVLDWIG